jgi:copper(I)-binding protein
MKLISMLTAAALTLASFAAAAHCHCDAVAIDHAWARATVKGQMATGAFMTLTAKTDGHLVAVASPLAGVAQVHEMKMEGGVMKMGEVKGGLALPAGKAVALKPGGYHVMLMDLKQPLPKDSTLPLTLVFKDARGVESRMEIKVPVAATAPGAMVKPAPMDHSMHNMQGMRPTPRP